MEAVDAGLAKNRINVVTCHSMLKTPSSILRIVYTINECYSNYVIRLTDALLRHENMTTRLNKCKKVELQ